MGMRDRDDTNLPAVRNSPEGNGAAIRSFDFGRDAQHRAVRNATWGSSLTSYPLILGGFGLAAAFLLDPSIFLMSLVVGGGGLMMGLGNACYTYFGRGAAIAHRYLQSLNAAIAQERDARLHNLETELRNCEAHINGCDRFAGQAMRQLAKGGEKLESFYVLLNKKLNPEELMAMRVSGTVQQVYVCILDNLRQVVALLQAVSTIDEAEITARVAQLQKKENMTLLEQREMKTLKEQWELRKSKLEEAATLLTENEEALTELDRTAGMIAELETGTREAPLTMEQARKELAGIVRRSAARIASTAAGINLSDE